MQNQLLDDYLDNLAQQLKFLPSAERDSELAELRGHLEERIKAYEATGESAEQAFQTAVEKFGDEVQYLKQIKHRHYFSRPAQAYWFGLIHTIKAMPIYFCGACAAKLILRIDWELVMIVSVAMSIFDTSYRLDERFPKHKLWGLFGAVTPALLGLYCWILTVPIERRGTALTLVLPYLLMLVLICYIRPVEFALSVVRRVRNR
jgi:hypothetical protein